MSIAWQPAAVAQETEGGYPCAPLDVAVLVDSSTSMTGAIDNVKANIATFTEQVEEASGGNYRMALIDFATDVQVRATFAPDNAEAIRAAVPDLFQDRDNRNDPEAWDEALVAVVDARLADGIGVDPQTDEPWLGAQIGDFDTPFRPEAKKLIVLITDATPGGFDDRNDMSDFNRAYGAAVRAGEAGIRVATVFVPNGNHEDAAPEILQAVSNLTGSTYYASAADGSNVTDSLDLAVDTCAADSDGDGLYDVWETEGYDADDDGTVDVDLAAMGADPQRKDLFVQVNWMQPDGVRPCYLLVLCPGGSDGGPQPPDPLALDELVDVFAAAPVDNPDGTTGITVHIDAGYLTPDGGVPEQYREGGPSGEHRDVWYQGGDDLEEARASRARLISNARDATTTLVYYTEAIRDDADKDRHLLGRAPGVPGDTVLIAGVHMTSTFLEAATVIHELGHTLGLRHGGNDDIQSKPHYQSIMNYDAIFLGGLLRGGQGGIIDFSHTDHGVLDESALDEPSGIPRPADDPGPEGSTGWRRCPDEGTPITVPAGVPVDWNCDGSTDGVDIEARLRGTGDNDAYEAELHGRDDWATLTFTGGARGALMSAGDEGDDSGFTYDEWLDTDKAFAMALHGPAAVSTPAGTDLLRIPLRVVNIGTEDDEYSFDASMSGDWTSEVSVSDAADVPAGQAVEVSVDVAVPADLDAGDMAVVVFDATSSNASHIRSGHVVTVEVGPGARITPGRLNVDPDRPVTGEDFTATGAGFDPGQRVLVSAPGGAVDAQEVNADGTGSIEAAFTAPDTPGEFEMVAVAVPDPEDTAPVSTEDLLPAPGTGGGGGGDSGTTPTVTFEAPTALRVDVDVVAPPEPAAAPDPGLAPGESSPMPSLLVAAVAVAVGALAVATMVLGRRRRTRTAA